MSLNLKVLIQEKKKPNMIAGTAMVAIYVNGNVTYFAPKPKKCQTSTEE